MKTWEMIKELTEHPEKKFKCLQSEKWCFNKVVEIIEDCDSYCIAFKDDDGDWVIYSIRGTLYWEWAEVIQPVSFEEAYKDCKENGNTYTTIDNDQEMYRDNGRVEILECDGNDLIELNVEWIKKTY